MQTLSSSHGMSLGELWDSCRRRIQFFFPVVIGVTSNQPDTGHRRGLNASLGRTSAQTFDENNPGYGIGRFVRFEGGKWDSNNLVGTDADFTRQVDRFAKAAAEFGIPYLLGKGEPFEAIERQVAERNRSWAQNN
jgi:hypothetical protein